VYSRTQIVKQSLCDFFLMQTARYRPTVHTVHKAVDRQGLSLLPSQYSWNLQFVQVYCISILGMWMNATVLRICFTQALTPGHGTQTDSRTGFLRWAVKLENLCNESGLYKQQKRFNYRFDVNIPLLCKQNNFQYTLFLPQQWPRGARFKSGRHRVASGLCDRNYVTRQGSFLLSAM